jgi:hypothetical protein
MCGNHPLPTAFGGIVGRFVCCGCVNRCDISIGERRKDAGFKRFVHWPLISFFCIQIRDNGEIFMAFDLASQKNRDEGHQDMEYRWLPAHG